MEIIKGGVTAAKGFTASGMHVGLRRNVEKKDIALIYSDTMCNAAAVFTQNKIKLIQSMLQVNTSKMAKHKQ